MRHSLLLTLLLLSQLLLTGCALFGNSAGETVRPAETVAAATPSPSPTLALLPVTQVPEPDSGLITLRIWGPPELAPVAGDAAGSALRTQIEEFERFYPDIRVEYEVKSLTGPASLMNYLRSSSAVAPSVVPDLILIQPRLLDEVALTGLLSPLGNLLDEEVGDDFYPFVTQDPRIGTNLLAVPFAVQVEHGVTRAGQAEGAPRTLDFLLRPNAPIWLFLGQAREDGEMTNVLLVQLLAITEGVPGPTTLPEQEELVSLLATLQAAQQEGSVPRQNLLLSDEALLFDRLQSNQAQLIQSSSRSYLRERAEGTNVTFASLPTLNGQMVTVVDGYLIALTSNNPRRQEAVGELLSWLFTPERLAMWSRSSHWLPARRSAVPLAVDDEEYLLFLEQLLSEGVLRPGGREWSNFAQAMQEQFRAVMTEQSSPVDAAEFIIQSYGTE